MSDLANEFDHYKPKISTSQQRAVMALLVEPFIAAAAVKAGGGRTLQLRDWIDEHQTLGYS